MSQSHLIADSLVSGFAVVGLVVFIAALLRRGADGLTKRFLFGLAILAVMLFSRMVAWNTDLAVFHILTRLAAGLIPLATLILTEGILRRHAPAPFKWIAVFGTIFFCLAAFLPDRAVEPGRSVALVTYDLLAFAGAAWLVLTRDPESLSVAENRMIERIALSLLLIVPLLITEFRFLIGDGPVRLGAIAILAWCWLGISAGDNQISHRDTILAFVTSLAASIIAGAGIALTVGLNFSGAVQAIAITTAGVLTVAIINDGARLQTARRRTSLMNHLAYGTMSDPESFIAGLRGHSMIDGAMTLSEADLQDFDPGVLDEVFRTWPVVRASDVTLNTQLPEAAREQLISLFERCEATHVMQVSATPRRLVVVNTPAISTTPGAETELAAIQRLASLIAQKPGRTIGAN